MNVISRKNNSNRGLSLIDDFFTPNKLFSNALGQFEKNAGAVEVKEDDDNVYVHIELPGVNKDDVHLDLDKGILTVSAKREEKKESKEKDVTYSEFSYGQIRRSINVGNVDSSNAQADYKDGIVEVTLPKQEVEKSRKITFK